MTTNEQTTEEAVVQAIARVVAANGNMATEMDNVYPRDRAQDKLESLERELARLREESQHLRELCRRSHGIVWRRLEGMDVGLHVSELEALARDLLRAAQGANLTAEFRKAADIEAATPITGGAAALKEKP